MNLLDPFFNKQGFVMLDGGLATEMERHGADLDHELWSAKVLLDSPALIHRVHAEFLAAGADIIATATYQASIEGFRRAGYTEEESSGLMELAVELAVSARDEFWAGLKNVDGREKPLVAASIGPYGACLHDGSEYHGNYGLSRQQLIDFHRPRMAILAATGADLFAIETLPSKLEAETLLELLKEFPERHAVLSFSCRDGQHVSHGESFAECAALADTSGQIIAVGVNCTSPEHIASLLSAAQGISTPLVAYPNSGENWSADSQRWEGQAVCQFDVNEWFSLGARVIGGCCRTTVEDIREIRAELLAGAD